MVYSTFGNGKVTKWSHLVWTTSIMIILHYDNDDSKSSDHDAAAIRGAMGAFGNGRIVVTTTTTTTTQQQKENGVGVLFWSCSGSVEHP
jgi:hypothetical protein